MAKTKKAEMKSGETTSKLGTAGGVAAGAALGSLLGPWGRRLVPSSAVLREGQQAKRRRQSPNRSENLLTAPG